MYIFGPTERALISSFTLQKQLSQKTKNPQRNPSKKFLA